MKIFWSKLRQSGPITQLRNLLPHWLVNVFFHLPKAIMANIIYGFPARKLKVIGITGTKGKTTTAHILFHILKEQNKQVVLLSTIAAFFNEKKIDTGLHVTNPEPLALQKLLARAHHEGYEFVILEVTSHGLAQYRNWGITFELGVYTQVQADHLGYHGGIEGYRKAKAILIKNSKKVVLNQNDPSFSYLSSVAQRHKKPVIIYKGKKQDIQSQNQEAAISAAQELGINRQKARESLKTFPGVPGRFEFIKTDTFKVVIDFAHTPESLEAALQTLRLHVKKSGRLIAVFGCAGERDSGRRKMGAVAARLADIFIITAEDPRSEGVEDISEEIAKFALKQGAQKVAVTKIKSADIGNGKRSVFIKIPDRQEAINLAIQIAEPDDVVGLFGKGHEQSMCFGKTEHPWSEHQAVHIALDQEKGRK